MRELKLKLGWVVQTMPSHDSRGMRHEAFAETLQDIGCQISPSAITKWLDTKTPFVPNARHLRAINRLRPEVSLDWLLGVRDAQTVEEIFIEKSMKRGRT